LAAGNPIGLAMLDFTVLVVKCVIALDQCPGVFPDQNSYWVTTGFTLHWKMEKSDGGRSR
jgi:hypothetical protein